VIEAVKVGYSKFIAEQWGGFCPCVAFDSTGKAFFQRGSGVIDSSKAWCPQPQLPPNLRSQEATDVDQVQQAVRTVTTAIECCGDCPCYFDRTYCTHDSFKEWQFLPNPGGDRIPDWCPLIPSASAE